MKGFLFPWQFVKEKKKNVVKNKLVNTQLFYFTALSQIHTL